LLNEALDQSKDAQDMFVKIQTITYCFSLNLLYKTVSSHAQYKYLSEIERGISKPSVSTVINILNGFHLTLEEYLSKDLKNETISKNIEIQKILSYVDSLNLTEYQKNFLLDIVNIINEGRY